jgi:hypothetical protein
MRAKLVTGYVPIPNHPRGPEIYGELGEKLGGVPVRKKAFYQPLDTTWMHKFLKQQKDVRPSEGDNAEKNTAAYHCVNHQKSTWLVQAANEDPDADILVWIDYGIFRLPGVCNKAIYEFMEKVDDKAIYAPGCWDSAAVEQGYPCWRFCGSMLAVPRRYVDDFDFQCRTVARGHILSTKNVEWEVNTWARVERHLKLPFKWYRADHDVSMFDNMVPIGGPAAPAAKLTGKTHTGRMAR